MVEESIKEGAEIHIIPLNVVWCDEDFNTRSFIPNTDVLELAKDIKANGQLTPICVRPIKHDKYTYKIVYGHRRFKACKINKMETIEAFVKDIDEETALIENISENMHRKNLTLREEAGICKRLQTLKHLTYKEVAKVLNKSIGWVQDRIYYAELPDQLQEAYDANLIQTTDIRAFHKMLYGESKPIQDVLLCLKAIKESRESGRVITLENVRKAQLKKKESTEKPTMKLKNRSELDSMQTLLMDVNLQEHSFATKLLSWVMGYKTEKEMFKLIEDEYDCDVTEKKLMHAGFIETY